MLRQIIEDAGYISTTLQPFGADCLTLESPQKPITDVIADLIEACQGDMERCEALADALRDAVIVGAHLNPTLYFTREEAE